MTFNCLTCGRVLERTNSCTGKKHANKSHLSLSHDVERSWSGNLTRTPPLYETVGIGSAKKVGKVHRSRFDSMEEKPKLIRSGGMRREWSFENLRAERRAEKRMLLDKA